MRGTSHRMDCSQLPIRPFDTSTGDRLSELWDGEENSLEMMVPSPVPGDPRLLATTTITGIETLLIWNPRTSERTSLTFQGVSGAVRGFDWSADGNHILFCTFNSAVQQLYLHNLSTGETIPLRCPAGTNFQPYFTPSGEEIFSHWESSTQPTRLIALSPRTGEMLRTVMLAGKVPPGHEWQHRKSHPVEVAARASHCSRSLANWALTRRIDRVCRRNRSWCLRRRSCSSAN